MNIAFIGHAYHRTTRSADFFVQLLEEMGKVDCFYDDSLDGGRAIELDRVSAGYDLIVVWQIEYVVPLLVELGLANIVFAPMYDGCMGLSKKYWQALNQTRILCKTVRKTAEARLQLRLCAILSGCRERAGSNKKR